MKRIIREILDNVLSGTKAGFKSILNLVFNQKKERKKMDNQKSKSTFSATLLALILGLIVLWTGLAAVAAEKKYVTDPSTGKVVVAPKYGGTLTMPRGSQPPTADTYYNYGWTAMGFVHGLLEKLGIGNWAIDRDEQGWTNGAIPLSAITGALAESWDISPDRLTYTFHIRKGVHWHDKPPVNGRELTAKDVEYNYHRYLGLGSGFTEGSPHLRWDGFDTMQVESVTATDKYTVVVKLKQPDVRALRSFLDPQAMGWLYAPEVIKKYGDSKDWKNLVGTGPWMLTDFVEASSWTYTKNPNYWGYDEKYPENRLPYADELRMLFIVDDATVLSALRTGKLDWIGSGGWSVQKNIDQMESLQQTDPEIVIYKHYIRSNNSYGMNVSKPPFNDIRVRQAMNMAVDLETINKTYYIGVGNWLPQGQIANDVAGGIPFEEWPEELKKGYMYDPEGAENLLDEAGYQRGSDGIRFKTKLVIYERYDLGYAELVAVYLGKIGIDLEFQIVTGPENVAIRKARTFEMVSTETAMRSISPIYGVPRYQSHHESNTSAVEDPDYDAMYKAAAAASTEEEQERIVEKLNMYNIEKHWRMWGVEAPWFTLHQPWVKGLNGEYWLGNLGFDAVLAARVWIDQELKESMGY